MPTAALLRGDGAEPAAAPGPPPAGPAAAPRTGPPARALHTPPATTGRGAADSGSLRRPGHLGRALGHRGARGPSRPRGPSSPAPARGDPLPRRAGAEPRPPSPGPWAGPFTSGRGHGARMRSRPGAVPAALRYSGPCARRAPWRLDQSEVGAGPEAGPARVGGALPARGCGLPGSPPSSLGLASAPQPVVKDPTEQLILSLPSPQSTLRAGQYP